MDGSKSADPDTVSEIEITQNNLINDDEEGIGNAVAISRKNGANAYLTFTSNNMEKIAGSFMVYLFIFLVILQT